MVLQPTTFCNIDCQYCYLPDRANSKQMPMELVRRIAVEVFGARLFSGEVTFLWHLGEPLSVRPEFYEKAFSEIARANEVHGRGYRHVFQTNATLMNEKWINLIQEHRVRVGVSLDGPDFIHDRQRITRRGKGTHAAVLDGVRLMQAHEIPFGVIAVLTDYTLDYPDEFFNFFRMHGIARVGFNIDEIEGVHTSTSFLNENVVARYKRFLMRIIQLSDISNGAVRFREVWSNLRSIASGVEPYRLANKPFRIMNFDVDGNFSTYCPELVAAKSDKYSDFVMGNILRDSLDDLPNSPVFQLVNREVEEGLSLCERTCSYWNHCGGGEPSSKFFQYGRFDVSETTTCRIHRQATVDTLVDYLERRMADGVVG
ncbi:GRRM system radical SAM/SPASM domain protein [Solwaraspora sp. WMMD937]|uniref:cyclophane-forming radical SAM/SPASM peptide maturase GrrM/OscB n=1 Tax=Solwaraspora sp. WMMD937 TaxID=3016090 RepID=UPI00249A4C28|nr:cyclophane-forming radical SAM/SPASM peptide maturase GrrM/OscB [Solwaraspora sp. WMMD937]WFE21528.1 GRRM system radical SAM/SPASM domain protein [Solwaraspora sp. WMMD937]